MTAATVAPEAGQAAAALTQTAPHYVGSNMRIRIKAMHPSVG